MGMNCNDLIARSLDFVGELKGNSPHEWPSGPRFVNHDEIGRYKVLSHIYREVTYGHLHFSQQINESLPQISTETPPFQDVCQQKEPARLKSRLPQRRKPGPQRHRRLPWKMLGPVIGVFLSHRSHCC